MVSHLSGEGRSRVSQAPHVMGREVRAEVERPAARGGKRSGRSSAEAWKLPGNREGAISTGSMVLLGTGSSRRAVHECQPREAALRPSRLLCQANRSLRQGYRSISCRFGRSWHPLVEQYGWPRSACYGPGPGWPGTVRTCGKSPGIASAARCRITTRFPVITGTAKAGQAVTLKRRRRPGDRARAAPPIAGVCCRRLPARDGIEVRWDS